jgi:hypothetical protein
LARCLSGHGERLVLVPPKLMGQSRRGERGPGNSAAERFPTDGHFARQAAVAPDPRLLGSP